MLLLTHLMKFAIAVHGTRGDVEPCAAVGVELQRRGHEVRMAVPPNLVDFVAAAGLSAVPYGPDSQRQLEVDFFRDFWSLMFRNPIGLIRLGKDYVTDGWADMSATLTEVASGADLILTGTTYQEVAANVAEYHGVPFAALHYFPLRVNGRLVPKLPAPVTRCALRAVWWLYWLLTRDAENAQRRELGLPTTTVASAARLKARGALEIQAYDEVCFPGVADDWDDRFPFVGALTMEMPTEVDDAVMSWISAGDPPVYFGFGSMPVQSPAATVEMIKTVCGRLGVRALICGRNFEGLPDADRTGPEVKIVDAVNHAAVFPACRAVVHHGGAGTTAAGLRAGVPTLILWVGADQPIWAAQIRRMKVGTAQRFTSTSARSLTKALRTVLDLRYADRARDVATQMTKPAAGVTETADLLERTARRGHAGPDFGTWIRDLDAGGEPDHRDRGLDSRPAQRRTLRQPHPR
ncbi:glycosyltransferase [Mycolicibacterium thermoresistibile]|uniref:Glycosyltransferase n=2 Tax=Mycolicibacterium thermoresistibile TaxID=1797 RepID=A0A100XIW0_MYCTH|nr:glycosyltransferase [Mycolicibacterium thermoresistibile]